jgi:hypothetical protein
LPVRWRRGAGRIEPQRPQRAQRFNPSRPQRCTKGAKRRGRLSCALVGHFAATPYPWSGGGAAGPGPRWFRSGRWAQLRVLDTARDSILSIPRIFECVFRVGRPRRGLRGGLPKVREPHADAFPQRCCGIPTSDMRHAAALEMSVMLRSYRRIARLVGRAIEQKSGVVLATPDFGFPCAAGYSAVSPLPVLTASVVPPATWTLPITSAEIFAPTSGCSMRYCFAASRPWPINWPS